MLTLRTVAVAAALIATAAVAAPLAPADAARDRVVIQVNNSEVFSPNGDHSKDRARLGFTLGERSEVTVIVHRTNKLRTKVYRQKLGELSRGRHTWTWKGKNLGGKVVRDGRYSAVFVADQVAQGGMTRRDSSDVFVATSFETTWEPELNADTVYPNTTLTRDFIGMTLGDDGADPMTTLGQVVMTVNDAQGREVLKPHRFEYHSTPYTPPMPILISGRDDHNRPLPAGAYRWNFKVWDRAGNAGTSKAVTVHVSDQPLVEASGSLAAPPTGSWKASQLTSDPQMATPTSQGRDGRSSTAVCCDPQPIPCGTVVPSEVYHDHGAASFRSSDTCGDTWLRPSVASADGSLEVDTMSPRVAPRGLQTSWLAMRGKPTVTGEVDTARLSDRRAPHVLSDAVAEESVTTTQPRSYPWEPPYSKGYMWRVNWSIATVGVDSYDVAAVTVHYTFLTPQTS